MSFSKRILMIALLLAGTLACVDMVEENIRVVSVGHTGCAEEDLLVTDIHGDIMRTLWTATCHGHRFLCSQVGHGSDCHEVVSATSSQ